MNSKVLLAGAGQSRDNASRNETLLYSGVALGVLVGASISTYIWRQRVRAAALLNLTPLERAEKLIEACEAKLDSIEKSVREVGEKK